MMDDTMTPSSSLYVIGITGTNGKTTVSCLINAVLLSAGIKSDYLGTLNSGSSEYTTPNSIDIKKRMASHLQLGGTHFVMEVTSESIEELRIQGIDFDIKLLTNISHDHLDYHKTFKKYRNTKLRFMRDGRSHRIYPKHFKRESIPFKTHLPGDFNKLNMQAAVSVLRHIKIREDIIEKTLSTVSLPPGRLEQINMGQNFLVFVDYAHTPDAFSKVLVALKEIAEKRNGMLKILFGCGGDRDKSKRPVMGKLASQNANYLVITDDNPRSEESNSIMLDIISDVDDRFKSYIFIQDRAKAIEYIISDAKENDVIALLGKGHEDYQQFNDMKVKHSDKISAEKAILKLFSGGTINQK